MIESFKQLEEVGRDRDLAEVFLESDVQEHAVPADQILDTSGAGDVFHGAYLYSYLANPNATWESHFRFARAASAHKIQHLGNEAGLPTLEDIEGIRRRFGDPAEAARQPPPKFGDHSIDARAERTPERLS